MDITHDLYEPWQYTTKDIGSLFRGTRGNQSYYQFETAVVDPATQYLIVSAVAGLSLLTVLGNLSVIVCVVKSRRLNGTNYSVYILSLACADLIVGAVTMPIMALYTHYGYWPLGNIPCTSWIIADFCCCTVSTLHLNAIAFDRERAVAEPLKYRSAFTKSRARNVSVAMWIFTFIVWMPGIIALRMLEEIDDTLVEDACYFMPNKYYRLAMMSLFYVPILFMSVAYGKLVMSLHKRAMDRIKRHNNTENNTSVYATNKRYSNNNESGDKPIATNDKRKYNFNNTTPITTSDQLGHGQNTEKGSSFRNPDESRSTSHQATCVGESSKVHSQNARAIRTLGVMIIMFLICWLPWCLFWPVDGFCATCISNKAFDISYWMVYSNSCVNPYLYFIFNEDFRSTFLKIVCHILDGK